MTYVRHISFYLGSFAPPAGRSSADMMSLFWVGSGAISYSDRLLVEAQLAIAPF